MPARSTASLSGLEARRLAIAAQGLAAPRPATPLPSKTPVLLPSPGKARAQLRRVMDQVGTIQLDAVNVLARTQFLVPFSRIGSYDPAVMRAMSGPGADWFEYWGHAASLLPVELYPLFRPRMELWREDSVDSPVVQQRRKAWRADHAAYIASVLGEVAERGPLAASQLSEPRRQTGEWWDRRSVGRRALEMLFADGVVTGWRSANFERVYDLTERVIPHPILDQPAPERHQATRDLLALAVRSLGVATAADLADYFWIRLPSARPRVEELVEEGRLVPVTVEGWARTAYVPPGPRPRQPRDRRQDATLLSPFDSLIWYRDRAQRLFDFHYRIEIYVPGPQRNYGYYVMPLLLGEQLVGRFDLKSDRKGRALLVVASYAEPGQATPAVAEAALAELHRLRQWLDLDVLTISERGELSPLLRSLVSPRRRSARAL